MTANTGYGVKDVKVDGTSVGPVTSYTFENVNGNHTIEVEFDTATTVTTAQQFRDAVKQDGIIILANDITLDDNGNVEISKNVIIHGTGNSVFMKRYSRNNGSQAVYVKTTGNAKVQIENCSFRQIGEDVPLVLGGSSIVEIYGGTFDQLSVEEGSSLVFFGGSITDTLMFIDAPTIRLFNGVFRSSVVRDWPMFLNQSSVDLLLSGGTYYFEPTRYLDTDKYKATKTKDTDDVDIWVVTEK